MKKILVSILLVLATVMSSFAQENYQDVVYLKNGSIIRGFIIEQVINKSIKIQTADDNVFVFQIEEVEKIGKELRKGKSNVSLDAGSGLKGSYKPMLELGYQFKTGLYGANRFNVNIINSYQFNPHLSIGLGTGLRYYFDAEAAIIPLFADLRVNILDKKISPYFSLGLGYSFNASNDFDGVGFLINPAVGVNYKLAEKTILNLGIGFESQTMDFYEYNYYNGKYNTFRKGSGAICLNLGVSF